MKKRKLKWLLFLICCVIGYIAIGIYSSYYCLKVEKADIKTEKLTVPVTIVQLSDIHSNTFVNKNQNLIAKIRDINPDIIAITGDIINTDDSFEKMEEMKALISDFVNIAPVYLSLGNQEVEYMEYEDNNFIEQFSDAGAIILEREYRDIEIKGQNIRIGGVYGYCLPEKHRLSKKEEVRFLRAFEKTDSYKILLSHLPYAWIDYGYTEDYDVDLIFSGHLHGGQVRILILGGLYAPEMGLFPGNLRGIYQENNTNVVLSSGLGSSTQNIPRFNNIPEIIVTKIIPQ